MTASCDERVTELRRIRNDRGARGADAHRLARLSNSRIAANARSAQHVAVFVIELIYKVDLAQIDAAMKAHVAWLQRHYAAGTFLVSGRKIPRDGGIILATGGDRAQLEAIVRADPFVARGLADVRLIEFRASQRADDMPKRIQG